MARYNLAMSFFENNDRKKAEEHLRRLEQIDFSMAQQLRKQFWKKFVVDAEEMKRALN